MTAKGLMNRSHAYKAAVAENDEQARRDPDKGINMGLYCYPILMAADILMFKANKVPVGKDQIQHLEMTRDIAGKFNHVFSNLLVLPEAVTDDSSAVLVGLDGRKMSKSYNNTIPLFAPEKKLRKLIMKIKTNSLPPEAPKDPENCTLFAIYRAFSPPEAVKDMAERYRSGIPWGTMKQELFELLNDHLSPYRQRYQELLADPQYVNQVLADGARKAREFSVPYLEEIRQAVGYRPLDR
jgi:tryptophanyl-tRNA synthetase